MQSVFLRFPDGKPKALTFSYDDGVKQDRRLAEIFTKYKMKATFNFNSLVGRSFTAEDVREIFLNNGHEIAVHGQYHRANGNTRAIEGIQDVLNCRLELEKVCGRIIRGMAYPDTGIRRMGSNASYQQIKNYLTDLDIAYARTAGEDNDRFELPTDFHAWVPTAHHTNPQIMEYIDRFLNVSYDKSVYHSGRFPRLMYIWGHSFEFDGNNNWELIEEICQKLADKDDIWYATNIEIYDYVEGYKRLVFSADGHKVYNPNLFDIWLDVDKVLHCVKSGETITI